MHSEGCLLDILPVDHHLMVSSAEVKLGEDTTVSEFVEEFIDCWYGKAILDGYCI